MAYDGGNKQQRNEKVVSETANISIYNKSNNFIKPVNMFENDNVLLISVISVLKKYSNGNAFNV